ncbi:hypothetical protein SCP_0213410 [Sparassis crispa]|uniref:DUF6589 domain-containing protein n=1 Tax=Sparassis crispa TaxID=139825 RepID=A0A401GD81_9APHY|nr:hypothetical protein SCP_0213410 [Sparassis crispa]GBE80138.1 hypothetical protein SCP_0213410 [Sparassis crispa]
MSARNLHFSAFRKVVGVWLFTHTSQHGVYAILTRFSFTVSYTSVLKLLHSLSQSAKSLIQQKAKSRAFLLIYDNINQMSRAWDLDLGQKDTIHNGTAATFVELDDCDVTKAFDVNRLHHAQQAERRKDLNLETLYKWVDWERLNATITTHILSFLVEAVPALAVHHEMVQLQLKTTLMVHRMRTGRQTGVHPLTTSNHNEGNTAENAKVLEDLLMDQLQMSKEEVEKGLILVGSDQSTVKKLRTLKKYVATCLHGYSRHGWVLPLIQLWHMGWADLEHILSTHWGTSTADDLSSFRAANVLLGRKVKDQKRPDYYPTQHLVFDMLKAEILDCWRIHLKAENLKEYFCSHSVVYEQLLKLAVEICDHYLTADAYDRALNPVGGQPQAFFGNGTPWTRDVAEGTEIGAEPFPGDQVLANTILHMRDSIIHYEFQCAIADGDIGRAMNVMAIWTFTFAGSGRSKYANELLEFTCQFEFEYSEELKTAIKNNWLCNLSGIEGCWFPMDLLQEKNIKQLKKMSQRKDNPFGGEFFKNIVAMNIRAFLQAIVSMRDTVRLLRKGSSH